VQAREGLNIGIAVAVRYRIDPRRLSYIHANLPGDIGGEVVAAGGGIKLIVRWRRTTSREKSSR